MTIAQIRELVDRAARFAPVESPEPPAPFVRVNLRGRLVAGGAPRPACVIADVLPCGVVTLTTGHGEMGKSTFALMQVVCVAAGLPWLEIPSQAGRAVIYSAEDPADVVVPRLGWICAQLGVDPDLVAERVLLLDATEGDPVLFRNGSTTPAFDLLSTTVAEFDPALVVIDNASDTFDDDEVRRARVRAFMRALGTLAKSDRAVELLAHVDKATARGDLGKHSEGYSGSSAWHNSARSRLFLRREPDGALILEHQKANLTTKREPLRVIWPRDQLPQVDRPRSAVVQGIADRNDTAALLRLVAEFTNRGESVSTATGGPSTAPRLLCREPTYPHGLNDGAALDLLRQAERRGWLARVEHRTAQRHRRERWEVTSDGRLAAGIEAPAPVAPVARQSATDATSAAPSEVRASVALGGMGE